MFDTYVLYWPVIAAGALFLILGLWWRMSAARAMELAPKSPDWVRQYRSGAFPFRSALPQQPRIRLAALLSAFVLGAVFAAARFGNTGMIVSRSFLLFSGSRYGILLVLLKAVGASAVFLLLNLLFDSLWVTLPGTLLFAASAARGHSECCFLAFSLLLLLLYLRAEKPGFPAELLYLAAIVSLAPMLALRPALAWLILCFPPVHWYKLVFQRRTQQLSGGQLVLALLLSALSWAACLCLAVLLYRFLVNGLALHGLLLILQPKRFLLVGRIYLRGLLRQLLIAPMPGMTVDLMVDAPLFGFGIWGCCSAWRLGHTRRDARGVFILLVLAALFVVWLLTGAYVLTLGLTLTTACILHDAELGKKRTASILLPLIGMLWYVGISVAAWYFPLTKGLLERLM